ncbi:hypothetical protein [Streptomyces sp. NPDC014734]|uniref:hypothetical protein n=1 Tax=Streptomyces sp. NPDC014734 TaxID=3364886 RepID=UPI0036F63F30
MQMQFRKLAMVAAGIMGTAVMSAAPSQATPRSPSSQQALACQIEAFGHMLPVVCGSKPLNADWNKDGSRDEVFFISPPNSYVYRISRASNGPVRVSNGVAHAMDTYEIRPSGLHRVYAVTAGSTRIYSQLEGGSWTRWEKYVP